MTTINDPLTTCVPTPCAICGANVAATEWYIANYGADSVRCWMHFGEPLPTSHPDDCTCDACRATFDAVMWGWLTPEHVAIAERERRSGDIPTN